MIIFWLLFFSYICSYNIIPTTKRFVYFQRSELMQTRNNNIIKYYYAINNIYVILLCLKSKHYLWSFIGLFFVLSGQHRTALFDFPRKFRRRVHHTGYGCLQCQLDKWRGLLKRHARLVGWHEKWRRDENHHKTVQMWRCQLTG